jgi:ribosome biogenesis GTPase A
VTAKKKQIQEKRKKKREKEEYEVKESEKDEATIEKDHINEKKLKEEETFKKIETNINSRNLKTIFFSETRYEVDKRIENSRKPLVKIDKTDPTYAYQPDPKTFLEIPQRPDWTQYKTKELLEEAEISMFHEYIVSLHKKYESVNYFEHNLEVWRQLWRTLEISDVLLLVVDIRHPLFHFPPSLYYRVVHELNKPLILLLNKCDLVTNQRKLDWIQWFEKNYPKLFICTFSSFFENKKSVNENEVKNIWKTCHEIKKLDYWLEPLKSIDPSEDVKHNDEYVTLGLIGHPNVGKSCVLNSLVKKHVVSVSSTPGHTKHLQTYFVSQHVRLCDSPGMVFPAIGMPKELQIISGLYPIAQVREQYSSIQYVAQRVDLVGLLKLKLPEDYDVWSAWAICEAYANRCRYVTKKQGRPDVYRAGNELLRMIFSGEILFAFEPPKNNINDDFTNTKPIKIEE